MKPMACLAGCCILMLVTAGIVQAQGMRGFGGMGRASGSTVQSGTIVVPGLPQIPAMTQGAPSSRQNITAPNVIVPGNPQSAARQFHHGGVFVPPVAGVKPPRFVLGDTRNHLHHPWFFHHPTSVLVIDVPDYYDSPVITQYVPGTLEPDPRFVEESPSDVRTRRPSQLAPFDPTPNEVVDRMLALAKVKKGDVVYDLGSGDGRIVIAAAKKYGVHAVGFEIDPGLAKLARENVRRAGVDKLVEIRQQDFQTANLSAASVVTLYLSYDGNLAVRSQLVRQLKPDARVVSYTFDMADWQPKIAETFRDSEGNSHQIYLWQIGEPLLFSDAGPQILQPQPMRRGPLIIDVR